MVCVATIKLFFANFAKNITLKGDSCQSDLNMNLSSGSLLICKPPHTVLLGSLEKVELA